ncbi:hypothetical protein N9L68_04970 [bacterium]|nr:hypothetical protein [bacterium]
MLDGDLAGATYWISTAVDASTSWHISDARVQASAINIKRQLKKLTTPI